MTRISTGRLIPDHMPGSASCQPSGVGYIQDPSLGLIRFHDSNVYCFHDASLMSSGFHVCFRFVFEIYLNLKDNKVQFYQFVCKSPIKCKNYQILSLVFVFTFAGTWN